MLSDKKLSNYAMYALGEILLVVIGILIAVQVNNWNTKQNNIKNAKEYLSNLDNELSIDTLAFGKVISIIEQQVLYKKMVIKSTKIDSFPIDYLDFAVNTKYYGLKINDATFLEIKDLNVSNLSEFKDIFKRINSYYTSHQNYLNNFSEWEEKLATRESSFWEEQGDFEISLLSNSEDSISIRQNEKERKRILVNKINSIKGRNFLKLNLFRLTMVKERYISIKKYATKLLKKIEEVD